MYGNLTTTDTVLSGCDYYGPRAAVEDHRRCAERHLDFESELFDFYRFTAPIDPRLPGGGGYVIRGSTNQKAPGALPAGGGAVTLIRDDEQGMRAALAVLISTSLSPTITARPGLPPASLMAPSR